MKKITKRTWVILIVTLLIMMGIIYIYEPFSARNHGSPPSLSSPSYDDTGLFRIFPATILSSLEKGVSATFLPDSRLFDERYRGPALYNGSVSWSQSDNLKIASALNNYVWNDALDDWKLFRMIFNVDCQDSLIGPPGGIFTYYKTTYENGKIVDNWREIEIDPVYSFVAWGGNAEFPHPILGWKSIDLSRIKVAAEDAIRIAEENGGKEARLRVQNQCNIHLFLRPQGYRGWLVDYQSADFEVGIDPYTGDVIK